MDSFEYQRTVIGYHGCDEKLAKAVLLGEKTLEPSNQPWDWLGRGIYLWEFGPERALEWASRKSRIKKPAVLGVLLHLGRCFDLLDVRYTRQLAQAYPDFVLSMTEAGLDLPQNETGFPGDPDLVKRRLDCAVINWWMEETDNPAGGIAFQTVRGAFIEGNPVFPGAGIYERTHIQIAVRDPACILGYFRPQ